MSLADLATVILTGVGLFFFIAGTVGLLRFPDVFSRLHGLAKADNPGLGLIVLGLIPQTDSVITAVQLLLIWLLVMAASAASSYLVANQAASSGRKTSEGSQADE
jgi:multicomponent Na+:H+ antiporter subunit G